MKTLTEKEILQNWEELLSYIDKVGDHRKENLRKLYEYFEDELMFMPASGKEYFHSCHPGGYVEHVLNVIKNSIKLSILWDEAGSVNNFTEEELIFCALNHDLGKVGDKEHNYYEEHNDNWRKQRGELYKHNEELTYMEVADRSLFLLQEFNVPYNQNEFIAIKLHDGMYSDANKTYLVGWSDYKSLRSNLPIVLHHADMMSTRIEYEQWKSTQKNGKSTNIEVLKQTKHKGNIKKLNLPPSAAKIASNFFDGDKS